VRHNRRIFRVDGKTRGVKDAEHPKHTHGHDLGVRREGLGGGVRVSRGWRGCVGWTAKTENMPMGACFQCLP